MRILTLLHEHTNELSAHRDAFEQIALKCSEFLSNPTPLYRGYKDVDDFIYSQPIRTDRRSLSGRHLPTLMFNMMFEEEFGFPRVRNQCAFLTNSYEHARGYGNPFFVFPINGSLFASNPMFHDSVWPMGGLWHDFLSAIAPGCTKADISTITDAIPTLDTATSTPEQWQQFIETLSPDAQRLTEEYWEKAKDDMFGDYVISGAKNIDKYAQEVEYMLYKAPSVFLVNIRELKRIFESDDLDVLFNTLIKHIGTLNGISK